MAWHLLVLEHLARILPIAGRADAAVADRDAVRGSQAGEIPPLHATGIALTHRGAGHIDILAGDEMIDGDLGTDFDQVVCRNPKLLKLPLRLDFGHREMTAIGLGQALDLGRAGAKLERGIAVLLSRLLATT